MKTIEVCLSQEFAYKYNFNNKIAVVVDIFRATSCIITGLANQIATIWPVAEIDDCDTFKKKGYLLAGERNGLKIDGFNLGNSPFDYMDPKVKGKHIAICTTNGSKAIINARDANKVMIGAFLNLNAVAEEILQANHNIIILCSGWRGFFSFEDTLFAGALLNECLGKFEQYGDATIMAHQLFLQNATDMLKSLQNTSHGIRLTRYGYLKDIIFCTQTNRYSIVPKVSDNGIIL